MIRETSIQAYNQVCASGILGKMQLKAYEVLSHLPDEDFGITGNELDQICSPGKTNASYHKRLSELERMGLAHVIGKRICKISGHEDLVWGSTELVPENFSGDPNRISKKEWADAAMDAERFMLLAIEIGIDPPGDAFKKVLEVMKKRGAGRK